MDDEKGVSRRTDGRREGSERKGRAKSSHEECGMPCATALKIKSLFFSKMKGKTRRNTWRCMRLECAAVATHGASRGPHEPSPLTSPTPRRKQNQI